MDPRGVKLMYPIMVGPLNRGSTMLLEQERRDFFDEFLKILGQPKEYYRKVLAKYLRNGTLTEHLQGPDLSSLVREATRYLSSERTTTGYTCFEALQVLLEIVPSIVEACDYHRRTALSYAAEFQNAHFTELLLRHGANPHAQDEGGRTPLSWAATLPPPGTPVHSSPADAMVITHLLKNGADVNSEDHSGRTPLILAAKEKSYDLIELLIDNGANSAQRDMDGCTCFWWLLEARRRQGLRPEGDSADRHRVFLLVQKAYKSSVRRDKNDRTPLSWAVEFQDFDMVAALLYSGADPETSYHDSQDYWETPFLQALGNSNGDIMRLFIRLEIVVAEMTYTLPARNDKSSLHRLIKKSHWIGEEKALKLLEKAIELQYVACRTDSLEGKSPLHYAIGLKKESLALKLIDNLGEVELNVRDNNGKTPLLYALEKEMWNVAQRLVQRGANIDLSQPEMWFNLGTPGLRYIRFTRKPRFSNTELIYQPPNQRDWLPNGKGNILCFHEEKDSEWSRLKMRKEFPQQRCEYIHHACLKSKNSSAEWMESHISVLLPNMNNFWGIEWSVAEGKGSGFVTTIPSSTFPESWEDLCEQFLRQLHEKWENICVDAGKAIENIRQKQLKNQGQNRKIIYNLAQSASTRAEFRLYLQQHVLGLKEAVKNNSIIKAQDEKDLIGTINHINEFVKMRLDGVEQAGKELLQMELAWISISEASSIKRISWVTFIFLPLMFASSLFGMNVNLLENNPDWRWYLAIGALFLLLTVAIWMIFKVFSTESWKKIKNPWVEIKTFGLRTRKNPAKKDIYDMNSKV